MQNDRKAQVERMEAEKIRQKMALEEKKARRERARQQRQEGLGDPLDPKPT